MKIWAYLFMPVIPLMAESVIQGDHSPHSPWQEDRPYLKGKKSKRAGSGAEVVKHLLNKVQYPEFKPQYHKEKNKRIGKFY
jgi:hypothetical protein